MHKIKLGNDIQVGVSILQGEVPEDLSAATNIQVVTSQINAGYKTLPCYNLKVDGGKVSFLLKGADQLLDDNRYVGVYVVTISYNKPDPTQEPPLSCHTVDVLAFELIPHSFASIGSGSSCPNVLVETIELEGCVQFGKDGEKGDAGVDGADGVNGTDGKSAYQSALDGGLPAHITEEEFNQYLAMNSEIIGEALDEINGEGYDDNVIKKIVRIDTTKKKIAEAIVAKGVAVTPEDTFASYADKIKLIDGEIENLYKEFGFDREVAIDGVLAQMLRISQEESKDWGSIAQARKNTRIYFLPKRLYPPSVDMYAVYENCENLLSVPLGQPWGTTKMVYTLKGCKSLLSFPPYDTSEVTDMEGACKGCTDLRTIPLLDMSLMESLKDTLDGCTNLTNLGGFKGLKVSINLAASKYITRESMLNVFNNLADMTGQTSPIITLSSVVLRELSHEDRAIAINKNWTLVSGY